MSTFLLTDSHSHSTTLSQKIRLNLLPASLLSVPFCFPSPLHYFRVNVTSCCSHLCSQNDTNFIKILSAIPNTRSTWMWGSRTNIFGVSLKFVQNLSSCTPPIFHCSYRISSLPAPTPIPSRFIYSFEKQHDWKRERDTLFISKWLQQL